MAPITSVRQFFRKRYPRNHLLLASALSASVMVLAMLAPEEAAHGDRLRHEINGLVESLDGNTLISKGPASQQIMESVAKAAQEAAQQSAEKAFIKQVTVQQ